MNSLYLECFSGISGDMTVAALLDLGANADKLGAALDSMGVGGFHLHLGRVNKCGISAFDFNVHLEEESHGIAHQAHVQEEVDGHEHAHKHEHKHHHEHGHKHEHAHHHEHTHLHRNLADVTALLDRAQISEQARETAKRIFARVARAEAAVHGLPVEQVHFHEVGAVDSIVDIVGAAVCLDDLGITRVYCSTLYEGHGTVACQHGIMPVPAPATARIIADAGLRIRLTDTFGEMVTPTGAAIAAELCAGAPPADGFRILKTGYGAGKKDFAQANLLRAHLIEHAAETDDATPTQTCKLECNLDNTTGEQLGFAMERLLAAGALDVWFTPIQMKKCRPGVLLSVLCRLQEIGEMEELMLLHTGTLGVRRCMYERTVMQRTQATIQTPYGELEIKRAILNGVEKVAAEYESARKTAIENDLPLDEVYRRFVHYAPDCVKTNMKEQNTQKIR